MHKKDARLVDPPRFDFMGKLSHLNNATNVCNVGAPTRGRRFLIVPTAGRCGSGCGSWRVTQSGDFGAFLDTVPSHLNKSKITGLKRHLSSTWISPPCVIYFMMLPTFTKTVAS